jgi:outer membrane protein assembly factor BamB
MRVLRAIGVVVVMLGSAAAADDWPQWLGPRRDGVWREGGIVEVFPKDGPRIRWRRALGAGYSGPVVAEGRVYVTDRELRGGRSNPGDPFSRGRVPGMERVVCLDESDGRVIWQDEYACEYTISYPAGPRASPLVAGGRLYTVGAEGHVR